MKKFNEIEYIRPNIEEEKERIKAYTTAIKSVSSYEELRALFLQREKEDIHFRTMQDLVNFRNSIDARDPFYDAEMSLYNEHQGDFVLLKQDATRALLETPFVNELEAEFGERMIRKMEMELKIASPEIVDEISENAKLCQEYQKTMATCEIEYNGEICNLYHLLKYMESTDRSVRKAAFEKWAELYEQVSGKLDDIYDRMLVVRKTIAEKLGFESFIDYSYKEILRDYTPEELKSFRKDVKEYLVPICERVFARQKERLGIDTMNWYDELLTDPDGSANPNGGPKEMLEWAREMYRELSPETKECFDCMIDHEMFDLESKPGKQPGGYCELLLEEKVPFIFANFNGTSDDAYVLTHEAGHAFASYTASHIYPLSCHFGGSRETNETHAMSMEFFTYPWMEKFFGEQADQYRLRHLESALTDVAYMVTVDEFQHRVFEENLDAAGRRRVWRELERTYMPWREYDGNPFLEGGGFWMQKLHIFVIPFYYIDYALARMSSFEFYREMNEDYQKAWKRYYELCKLGGTKGYFDTMEAVGLSNPFHEGTMKKIADFLTEMGL